jgi:hypothetical protein
MGYFCRVMKKFFAGLLFLVFGLSSSGMTLHLHYCCGKLKNVQFSPVEKKHCGSGRHAVSKPCCDEKEISLKLKGDFNTAKVAIASVQSPAVPSVETGPVTFEPHHLPKLIAEVFVPPPIHQDIAAFYCVFRI